MAERERITDPSMGSNELGRETSEEIHTGVSAGSDTQLHITALAGNKHKKKQKTASDDILGAKNNTTEGGFLQSDKTDE
ncbi:MAG: hypothetical protein ABJA32_01530 [Ginsengibacter sp.]|jgi:hypothetical protein